MWVRRVVTPPVKKECFGVRELPLIVGRDMSGKIEAREKIYILA